MGELEVRKMIDAANGGRDRPMLEVAYFAACVSPNSSA
jgi:hypothetical protein